MTRATKKKQGLKTSKFSDFFRNASPEERDRVIKQVIRESNKDQRKLMDEAVKLSTHAR
jgi:hypothetical protein